MSQAFYMPPLSLLGKYALQALGVELVSRDFQKALIVTDKGCVDLGLINRLTDELNNHYLPFLCFDEVQSQPTEENVLAGLKRLQTEKCDVVISFGGGSTHDCAKAIALLATNGGQINDYAKGVHLSQKKCLPLITVNTTAGTGAAMTIFSLITDPINQKRYPIIDKNLTPIVVVNDSELMTTMPKQLTAITGMDALTHAIEAYVSTAATPITNAAAIESIRLIAQSLEMAVLNGQDRDAREAMQYAEFLSGMAFSNASLGYVHAMSQAVARQYDIPHGLCNAILLPEVCRFNARIAPEKFKRIADAMGIQTRDLTAQESAEAGISAIEVLSNRIGTAQRFKTFGLTEDDFPVMAAHALKDPCAMTNPRQAELNDLLELYQLCF